MKTPFLSSRMAIFLIASAPLHAAITQTFEFNEDTSEWGSAGWTGNFTYTFGFLDPSFGGFQSGGASSVTGQEGSRAFRSNTDGLDVKTEDYSIAAYVKFDEFSGTSSQSSNFYMVDGSFGNNNAGSIRVNYDGTSYTVAALNGGNYTGFNIDFDISSPYLFEIFVHPSTKTYDARISQVDGFGTILNSVSQSGMAFDGNTINNNANGSLLFHLDASSSEIVFRVDNINIAAIPEASTSLLVLAGTCGLLTRRRRFS